MKRQLFTAISVGLSVSWCYLSLKGFQLAAFCPLTTMYRYYEFKVGYLIKIKLFSIRIKELSEPLILWKRAVVPLFELKLSSYSQNIIFHEIATNFTYSPKNGIFKYLKLEYFRPTAPTLKKLWHRHVRNIIFHFISCERYSTGSV